MNPLCTCRLRLISAGATLVVVAALVGSKLDVAAGEILTDEALAALDGGGLCGKCDFIGECVGVVTNKCGSSDNCHRMGDVGDPCKKADGTPVQAITYKNPKYCNTYGTGTQKCESDISSKQWRFKCKTVYTCQCDFLPGPPLEDFGCIPKQGAPQNTSNCYWPSGCAGTKAQECAN